MYTHLLCFELITPLKTVTALSKTSKCSSLTAWLSPSPLASTPHHSTPSITTFWEPPDPGRWICSWLLYTNPWVFPHYIHVHPLFHTSTFSPTSSHRTKSSSSFRSYNKVPLSRDSVTPHLLMLAFSSETLTFIVHVKHLTAFLSVTVCPGVCGTLLFCIYISGEILNSAPFHAQKCFRPDDKT